MAGMFYSLKETAEKLNKTEQQVRKLARQGKLREFRDGPNLLFKIDEVEALMPKTDVMASKEIPPPLEKPAEPVEAIEPQQPAEEEEISLAPETAVPAAEGELTSADTALTGEGVSVLGETDHDYQVTDDTMAETTIAPGATGTAGTTGTTGEALLEEVEEEVSLDTFGSGSGLLDLSLQADDTSLGGILDEIYSTEGAEEGQEPGEPSSAVVVAAEAEPAVGGLPEEEVAGPQPVLEVPVIAQPYIEVPPDALSSSLGVMLFLPLLALVYAAIVAVAGLKNVMPAILGRIQTPYTALYIMAGFLLAAVLTFGISFMLSGGLVKAGTKEKKPKKLKKAQKTPPVAAEQ